MNTTMQSALIVARKELLEHVRTKRLLIVGIFFLLALILGLSIGIAVTRDTGDVGDRVVFVLGFYFGLFPLISGISFTSALGIMLSGDAIAGEWKDRTLFLLLSKPVSRSAVLWGKVLGAFVAVLSVFTLVFALGLAVVLAVVGIPDAGTFGEILAGFLIVAAGILPFVALGIFTSTVFKSPTGSFLVAFGAWFLILPLLGNLGTFIRLFQRDSQAALQGDTLVNFFHYFDPKWLMQQGATVMLGGRSLELFGGLLKGPNVGLVVFAMAVHIAVYLGFSFWIVNRRDYA
jgi:ABC-type transport system involved in multi-copper enzyme maturation permease subunit